MLPLDFSATVRALGRPLPVYDSRGAFLHGAWVESEPLARPAPIRAVALTMSRAELELLAQGSSAAGGIILFTEAELYFYDAGLCAPPEACPPEAAAADNAPPGDNPAAADSAPPGDNPAAPRPAPPLAHMELRQSYVDCNGRRYRVVGDGLTRPNASFNLYYCVRYLP